MCGDGVQSGWRGNGICHEKKVGPIKEDSVFLKIRCFVRLDFGS